MHQLDPVKFPLQWGLGTWIGYLSRIIAVLTLRTSTQIRTSPLGLGTWCRPIDWLNDV